MWDRGDRRQVATGTATSLEPGEGLTCDDDEGGEAGEGGDIDAHAVQALGELEDGVDPLPEATHALLPVQHHAVAEDELAFLWLGAVCQAKDEELQEGRLQQEVLVLLGQLAEALDLLGPLADDVHGAGEEVVELLHVHGVLLLKRARG